MKTRKKIGVLSPSPSSGCSFVSLCLAESMALEGRSVAFVETQIARSCHRLTYESIGLDKRFASGCFKKIYIQLLNGRKLKGRTNRDGGINWYVATPEERAMGIAARDQDIFHLVNNSEGDYVICDMGHIYSEWLIREMDEILVVIEPLPSKIMAVSESIAALKSDIPNPIWVLNRYDSGINMNSLKRFLRIKDFFYVANIEMSHIYRMEYNCRLPFEQQEIKEQIFEDVVKIRDSITLFSQ